jgi:pimeloyl-ACP methyl ester carboxylesterase
MVLPRIAEFRPDLVGKLVYVTCSAPPGGVSIAERMGNSLQGEREDEVGWPVDPATSTMEERYRVMFCNDMSEAATAAFLAKLGEDMWPMSSYSYRDWRYRHLAAIPSTFVLCLKDMSLPPIWQERYAEALHVDRAVRIDAGHQAMNTRPHTLAEVLLAEVR